MALDLDLLCLSGMGDRLGLLAANNGRRLPPASRGRTLSPLFASPEWGGTDMDRGSLDSAALEPSDIWNGYPTPRLTSAISGDQDRASTIPGAGRTSPAPRHIVRTA